MKKLFIFLFILISILFVAFKFKPIKQVANAIISTSNFINESGLTITNRVIVPENYQREIYPKGSFQSYIQNYKLKPYGAPVINYNGENYFNQIGHFGVLDIPVPKNGLQQCADALIRIRSEYLWVTNKKDEIGFNFTSGHYCSWTQFANGFRPKINGNKVSFHKTATKNHSKENFYKYLNLIYMYSGTMSLYNELPKISSLEELQVGDMLILGGSPGHVVMIGDVVKNEKGEKLFLLFQGNTPAQSIHLLKNLDYTSISPWYKLSKDAVVPVSNYTFSKSKFVRFK